MFLSYFVKNVLTNMLVFSLTRFLYYSIVSIKRISMTITFKYGIIKECLPGYSVTYSKNYNAFTAVQRIDISRWA